MAPKRFRSKIFRTGFTFAVTLMQYEKIKVELVAILVGHPVHLKSYEMAKDPESLTFNSFNRHYCG